MKRVTIDARAAQDIDRLVAKIHRDIGNPTAVVDLAAVRHVLKLDLNYYRSTDDGLLSEVLHKLQMGAKQVVNRPTLLRDAIRQYDLRALFLPDRKQILVDQTQPELKLRWIETHEIGHSIIPWHPAYSLGDDDQTLSTQCQEVIEAEANWCAGRLLFPPAAFRELARSATPSFKLVTSISEHFGNTLTSTLWRLVENADGPMFGVIGAHPHHRRPDEPIIAHFFQSERFAVEFPTIDVEQIITALRASCGYKTRGPLGKAEVQLIDANANKRTATLESFSNNYHCLTLGCL